MERRDEAAKKPKISAAEKGRKRLNRSWQKTCGGCCFFCTALRGQVKKFNDRTVERY